MFMLMFLKAVINFASYDTCIYRWVNGIQFAPLENQFNTLLLLIYSVLLIQMNRILDTGCTQKFLSLSKTVGGYWSSFNV